MDVGIHRLSAAHLNEFLARVQSSARGRLDDRGKSQALSQQQTIPNDSGSQKIREIKEEGEEISRKSQAIYTVISPSVPSSSTPSLSSTPSSSTPSSLTLSSSTTSLSTPSLLTLSSSRPSSSTPSLSTPSSSRPSSSILFLSRPSSSILFLSTPSSSMLRVQL
jgi:hypothetical protein